MVDGRDCDASIVETSTIFDTLNDRLVRAGNSPVAATTVSC